MSLREVVGVALISALLGGCGGKEQPAASPQPGGTKQGLPTITTSPNSPAQAAPPGLPPDAPAPKNTAPLTLPAGAKDENGDDIGLQKIQEALKQFIRDMERPPNGLDELVKYRLLPYIPAAPEGMKYAVDPDTKLAILVKK